MRKTREIGAPGVGGPGILAKPTILRPREHLTLARRADIEKRRVYESTIVDEAKTRKQVRPRLTARC